MQLLALIATALFCCRGAAGGTIVVPSTTQSSSDAAHNNTAAKPDVYYLHVNSDIKYRYARTVVSARIANPATFAQEVEFSAVIPDSAFISGFIIEVDDHVYKAYVREKEEAKKEYTEAVQRGLTAAHVALTARDSNRFTVSLNVEPGKKVTFNLTYEELLSRKLGTYRDVINLDPGQVVPDLRVVVDILESSEITTLKVPNLKVSNEISDSQDETNPLAIIKRPTPETAVITYAPTSEQQIQLAKDGLKGQLIVEYDVNRTAHPGEVLVSDGYFVHFFSPADLKPLPKHVTFVLDVSGSMFGRKIEQLREAMTTILADLHPQDLFSIVIFSETAQVWDPTISDEEMGRRMRDVATPSFRHEPAPVNVTPSVIVKVNNDSIAKAEAFVKTLLPTSSTDIYDALMLALAIGKLERETAASAPAEQRPEPIIIFLTDGLPNVRVSVPDTIVQDVTRANTANSSVFSLGFGGDVDFAFLKKLSVRNSGFARRIYEAGDAHLQLEQFYQEISSPVLSHVTFQYVPSDVDNATVTRQVFRRLFSGSELVVAGRLKDDSNFSGEVQATSASGRRQFRFRPIIIPFPPRVPLIPFPIHRPPPSSMEKLWAYLTIQQLLEEDQAKDHDKNQISPEKQRALHLALEYSFVTPLTSLVVVKPNETKPVDTQDAALPSSEGGQFPFRNFVSGSVAARPVFGIQKRRRGRIGHGRPVNPGGPIIRPMYSTPATAMTDHRLPFNPGGPIIRITAPPRAVTSNPNAVPCLASLSDVAWLNDNDTVTLPGASYHTNVLQLASANETNTAYASCATPSGQAGHCRHLRYCVLDTFTKRKQDFIPYFCDINSYVGVCCPDVPQIPQPCSD